MGDSLSNGTMAVGCRDQQLSWCSSVPQLLLPKFVASMIMMTAGYSTSVLPIILWEFLLLAVAALY